MNTKLIAAGGIFMSLWLIPPTNAIAAIPFIGVCYNASQCASSAQLSCQKYCCETGETGTKNSCPTGWSAGIDGTCSRSSVSSSDSKGWYTQEYGTCAATVTTYDCYTPSDVSSDYNGELCSMVKLPASCGS